MSVPPRNPAFFDIIAQSPAGQAYSEHPVIGHPLLGDPYPMNPPLLWHPLPAPDQTALGIASSLNRPGDLDPNNIYTPEVVNQVLAAMGGPPPLTSVAGSPMTAAATDIAETIVPGVPPGTPTAPTVPAVDPFASGNLPINEAELGQLLYDNPQLAISLAGIATPNTPGYNNLANLGFDPMAIYAASGGDLQALPSTVANAYAGIYQRMGTTGDQGGGVPDVGVLMTNLINAPEGSDLYELMAADPGQFYDMASNIIRAAGVSPMGQQAFHIQMAGLMEEYMRVRITTNAAEVDPFNVWMKNNHPDILESWGVDL